MLSQAICDRRGGNTTSPMRHWACGTTTPSMLCEARAHLGPGASRSGEVALRDGSVGRAGGSHGAPGRRVRPGERVCERVAAGCEARTFPGKGGAWTQSHAPGPRPPPGAGLHGRGAARADTGRGLRPTGRGRG